MHRHLFRAVLFLGLLAALPPAGRAAEPVIDRDVVYVRHDGIDLKLDLFRPEGNGPFPLIVWIHGGGWQAGSKADYHGGAAALARAGWAGATVQYRLAPKHKFPAQIEDVKTAIRFLRAKAADYHLDTERVAVVGASAGGHLALLAGFAGPEAGLEGEGYNDQSSRVKAVVNYFGPADLRHLTVNDAEFRKHIPQGVDKVLEDVVGTSDRQSAAMARFSPVFHLKPGAPPVLTIQGTDDPLVPKQQADLLHAALKKAGVPEELHLVEKGGHGNWTPQEHGRALQVMLAFLDKQVRGGTTQLPAPAAPTPPPGLTRTDVVYARNGGVDLQLDVAVPPRMAGPYPLLVWLHGGAWRIGDRKDLRDACVNFAKLGYVSATVQYRLAPAHQLPAQLEDVRAAVAFLRAHAAEYHLDPDRVALVGGSAGAHLALLAGLMKPKDGAAPVRAVISMAGPTDFRDWRMPPEGEALLKGMFGKGLNGVLADLLGTADTAAAIYAEASPLTHVAAGNPAVLTFQGTKDPLVPDHHARKLHAALKQAGVPEKLVLLEGVGHDPNSGSEAQKAQVLLEMNSFLTAHLKAKAER